MIDFHCHIDLYPEPASVLDEAERRDVHILAVTTTPKAWEGTRRLIADRRRVRVALGLHPELVAERYSEVELFVRLLPETRYVGEVGLDGSPHLKGSFALQQRTLATILLETAKVGGRVISLHSRRAAGGVLDAIEAQPDCGIPILHWFSGSMRELERAIRLGCWFSVGPLMTASAKGRALVGAMPRDRVLTETDAPFAQIDGVPLKPWDVEMSVGDIGRTWAIFPDEVERQLAENLLALGQKLQV